jgi:DNA-binding response OmpR family regulator
MEILVAEDEPAISELYQIALEERGHKVTVMPDGERAINHYRSTLDAYIRDKKERMWNSSFPFDVVILDYRMPKVDGLEVAKEILELNPHQRIIFASAFVRETLIESVKGLKQIVELLQKPFSMDTLIDTVEDKAIYEGLAKVNVSIKKLRELNPTHEQLRDLLKSVQMLRKSSAFKSALSTSESESRSETA